VGFRAGSGGAGGSGGDGPGAAGAAGGAGGGGSSDKEPLAKGRGTTICVAALADLNDDSEEEVRRWRVWCVCLVTLHGVCLAHVRVSHDDLQQPHLTASPKGLERRLTVLAWSTDLS
jgi:hypothetical protein